MLSPPIIASNPQNGYKSSVMGTPFSEALAIIIGQNCPIAFIINMLENKTLPNTKIYFTKSPLLKFHYIDLNLLLKESFFGIMKLNNPIEAHMKNSGKPSKGSGKPQKQKSLGREVRKPAKPTKIIKPAVRGR